MKKLLALLVCAILACSALLVLCACAEDAIPSTPEEVVTSLSTDLKCFQYDFYQGSTYVLGEKIYYDPATDSFITVQDDSTYESCSVAHIEIDARDPANIVLDAYEIGHGLFNVSLGDYHVSDVNHIVVRNNQVYYERFTDLPESVTKFNYVTYCKAHKATFLRAEGSLDAWRKCNIVLGVMAGDYKSAFASLVSFVCTEEERTDSGVTFSIDKDKLLTDVMQDLNTLATFIDGSQNLTFAQLYASQQMKDIVKPLLNLCSAQELATLFNNLVTPEYGNYGWPTPNSGEDAYSYLGRCLNVKVEGVTLGSILVLDYLNEWLGDLGCSATRAVQALQEALEGEYKNAVDSFQLAMNFDLQGKLTSITSEATWTDNDEDETMSVTVKPLDPAQMADLSEIGTPETNFAVAMDKLSSEYYSLSVVNSTDANFNEVLPKLQELGITDTGKVTSVFLADNEPFYLYMIKFNSEAAAKAALGNLDKAMKQKMAEIEARLQYIVEEEGIENNQSECSRLEELLHYTTWDICGDILYVGHTDIISETKGYSY